MGDAEFAVLQYEFKDGLNRYLAAANAGVKTLAEVIAFNKNNEAKAMPFFKQETLESSEEKGGLRQQGIYRCVEENTESRKIIDDMMREHTAGCDMRYQYRSG